MLWLTTGCPVCRFLIADWPNDWIRVHFVTCRTLQYFGIWVAEFEMHRATKISFSFRISWTQVDLLNGITNKLKRNEIWFKFKLKLGAVILKKTCQDLQNSSSKPDINEQTWHFVHGPKYFGVYLYCKIYREVSWYDILAIHSLAHYTPDQCCVQRQN